LKFIGALVWVVAHAFRILGFPVSSLQHRASRMLGIFSRHRPLALLAGTVLAQVLLLAFQIKREHDVRLIRYWAAEIVTPGARAGTWTLSKVDGIWTGYVSLHSARAENEKLRREVSDLRLRSRELENQAVEAQRLAALLNFREAHPEAPMLAAQVIGASADSASHTLFINRGDRDHVRRNQAVITPDGIVGKIVEVLPNTAQVLLINDKDSGVGALFADTRTHGVIKGNGDPQPRMDYVVNDEKVFAGEMILTSGEDRIFPKGLLVGTVAEASPGYPFQAIRVQPGARLDRLEDVLVLLSQQDLKKPEESTEAAAAQPGGTGLPHGIVQAYPAPPNSPAPVSGKATASRTLHPAGTTAAPPATAAKPAAPPAPPQ
jgi:rod shape-determining protein MreC